MSELIVVLLVALVANVVASGLGCLQMGPPAIETGQEWVEARGDG